MGIRIEDLPEKYRKQAKEKEREYHELISKCHEELIIKYHELKTGMGGYSKYRNVKTEADGEKFDSKRELKRWEELKLMERSGEIKNLKRQVRFELIPPQYENGKCVERSATYIADFVYEQDGKSVIEDSKGRRTDVYVLKRKLMLWRYGIKIHET